MNLADFTFPPCYFVTSMFEQDINAQSSDPDRTTDACGEPAAFSTSRFFLFLPVFLTMFPGSLLLIIWLGDRPFGIQFTSIIGYTAAAVLYTFSATKGTQRFLFDCPYVRSQFGRLATRHMGFLAALVLLETAALFIRPRLSPWWLTGSGGPKNMPPFILVVFILCGALLVTEILTNRSLLKRAHTTANPE